LATFQNQPPDMPSRRGAPAMVTHLGSPTWVTKSEPTQECPDCDAAMVCERLPIGHCRRSQSSASSAMENDLALQPNQGRPYSAWAFGADRCSSRVSDVVEPALRCYLICTVQRTGSWLLCHALEDSAVAGIPAEYFHRGDEDFWATRWGVSGDADFFAAMLREQPTPNGVFGSKMMWNYLDEALARLRKLSGPAQQSDEAVLCGALPGLRFVWVRRRDFLRQGISWWKAAVTGQYALSDQQLAAPLPDADYEAIGNLVRYAEECDSSWNNWFAAERIMALEVFYEDMVEDLEGTVIRVLAFLDIEPPRRPLNVVPRLRRQADEQTERIVEGYKALRPPAVNNGIGRIAGSGGAHNDADSPNPGAPDSGTVTRR
jgi:trehalose 2-sulfotransferase